MLQSPVLEKPKRFSPRNLPGLQLWLRAQDITGIANGGAVTTWSDRSGNGNNVTQGTAAARPTWQRNVQNGKAAVRFDQTDDQLEGTTLGLSAVTVFAVAQVVDNTAFKTIVSDWGADGSELWLMDVSDTEQPRFLSTPDGATASRVISTDPTVRSGAVLVTATHPGATGNQVLRTNRGQVDSDAVTDLFTGGTPTLRVGSGNNVSRWNDDICEILVYNRVLSAGEIVRVEAYLNRYYGLSV